MKIVKAPVYFLVVQEWLYPTESGRDVESDTYDTKEEALEVCADLVRTEKSNFSDACKCDPSPANAVTKDGKTAGFVITDKNGMEDWWFCAKVVEVEYGLDQMD